MIKDTIKWTSEDGRYAYELPVGAPIQTDNGEEWVTIDPFGHKPPIGEMDSMVFERDYMVGNPVQSAPRMEVSIDTSTTPPSLTVLGTTTPANDLMIEAIAKGLAAGETARTGVNPLSLYAPRFKRLRIYLAMPVTDFGTIVEHNATWELDETYGWSVVSPNAPDHQAFYQSQGMPYFQDLVKTCDALAFIRFEDGKVGAGVAKEIEAALEAGLRVMDLRYDRDSEDVYPMEWGGRPAETDILTVEETRAKIAAIRAERAAA